MRQAHTWPMPCTTRTSLSTGTWAAKSSASSLLRSTSAAFAAGDAYPRRSRMPTVVVVLSFLSSACSFNGFPLVQHISKTVECNTAARPHTGNTHTYASRGVNGVHALAQAGCMPGMLSEA